MAISVKDIQEKEFSSVAENGYDIDQVDDFLDELAEQLGAMTREKQELAGRVKELSESLAAAEAANAEMQKKLPDYNESGYFKNLESAMRESLIGAQRIADETVSEAKMKAQQTIDDARVQAERTVAEAEDNAKAITESAQQTVAELNAEADRLRDLLEGYKAAIRKLADEHLAAIASL